MQHARVGKEGTAQWVEVCFCATPLQEERPYWEQYFELLAVKDAHTRRNCRRENGTEPRACSNYGCTRRLQEHLQGWGDSFLNKRQKQATCGNPAEW